MFVLGIQGSPRKNGNTGVLLSAFMMEAERLGAEVCTVNVDQMNITPCRECGFCDNKGICSINDDMIKIYPLLRRSDLIVVATPIFFYSVTAQLKALVDRAQILWSRKYVLNLDDPGQEWRSGFLLALGATKGDNLFDGVSLTSKYFFDAVGADFKGSLTFRQIEKSGDIEKHPTALSAVKECANDLIKPLLNRKRVLFVGRENACESQMASAFTRFYAGDIFDVMSGGSEPADSLNAIMLKVMSEKGIDMAFRKPKSLEDALKYFNPDLVYTMGCGDVCSFPPDVMIEDWILPEHGGSPVVFMRQIRDDIERLVFKLIEETS